MAYKMLDLLTISDDDTFIEYHQQEFLFIRETYDHDLTVSEYVKMQIDSYEQTCHSA